MELKGSGQQEKEGGEKSRTERGGEGPTLTTTTTTSERESQSFVFCSKASKSWNLRSESYVQ